MIPVQPIQLYKYLRPKRAQLSPGIKRLFYLSWEDAFWDLMEKKKIKKGGIVLVPDFYCIDVEENIEAHGYKVKYYKVADTLEVNLKSFIKQIKKYSPDVVIIFHPVGITSNIFKNTSWVNLLKKEALLIEDSVHKIVDLESIKLIRKNHFIIDSLRKMVPIQGSNLIGKAEDLNFREPLVFQSFIYSLTVHFLWMSMIILWNLNRVNSHFGQLAEAYMLKGYDLIGTKNKPASGMSFFGFLFTFIDVQNIKKIKINQTKYYKEHVNLKNKIRISNNDFGELRGWPVILSLNKSDQVLSKIRNSQLLLRFELNGSKWTKHQKIIYLPMGPHLNMKDIQNICKIVNSALQT